MMVNFARCAKVIDMKQLKRCVLDLIETEMENKSKVAFHEIYDGLLVPGVLAPYMAANVSHSIAFYAVLHLCQEKGYCLSAIPDSKRHRL